MIAMFKRIIALTKALFGVGLDKMEDPDLVLRQAQAEMRALHAKNRERKNMR